MKNLELKNAIAEIKNPVDGPNGNRMEMTEERVSKCEEISYPSCAKERFKKRNEQSLRYLCCNTKVSTFVPSEFQKWRRVQHRKKYFRKY